MGITTTFPPFPCTTNVPFVRSKSPTRRRRSSFFRRASLPRSPTAICSRRVGCAPAQLLDHVWRVRLPLDGCPLWRLDLVGRVRLEPSLLDAEPEPAERFSFGMTTTGQGVWWTTCWLTEPSRRLEGRPAPRLPTTRRLPSAACWMSTSAGCPSLARSFALDVRLKTLRCRDRLADDQERRTRELRPVVRSHKPVPTIRVNADARGCSHVRSPAHAIDVQENTAKSRTPLGGAPPARKSRTRPSSAHSRELDAPLSGRDASVRGGKARE
jgi:hypothetical protein